ncbi:unnamed protein product [Chrysodeixis includens]|uniref:Uncharacterized protein n=1 Tax=Chrysodeixis includens TaxID=689277 RepID=A0A9N8L666_CHRIL|nr:unnamed protein product [Chrysodeixis includens]
MLSEKYQSVFSLSSGSQRVKHFLLNSLYTFRTKPKVFKTLNSPKMFRHFQNVSNASRHFKKGPKLHKPFLKPSKKVPTLVLRSITFLYTTTSIQLLSSFDTYNLVC